MVGGNGGVKERIEQPHQDLGRDLDAALTHYPLCGYVVIAYRKSPKPLSISSQI